MEKRRFCNLGVNSSHIYFYLYHSSHRAMFIFLKKESNLLLNLFDTFDKIIEGG